MTPATLGGLAALLGDLLWLTAEAVFEPLLGIPRQQFYGAICACFVVAVVLLLLEPRD